MRALNGAPPTDFSAGVPRNLFSETTLHSAKGAGSALSNLCRFLRHIHDSTETSYGLVIEDVPEEVLCSPVIYLWRVGNVGLLCERLFTGCTQWLWHLGAWQFQGLPGPRLGLGVPKVSK